MLTNFVKQLRKTIEEQQWGITINNFKNLPYSKIYISPCKDNPLYNIGNKFYINGSTLNISIIKQDDIKKHVALAKKMCFEKDLKVDQRLLSISYEPDESKFVDRLKNILHVFFSETFLEKNDLLGDDLSDKFPLDKNIGLISGKDNYQCIRYIEKFDDFKVAFAFSTKTGEFKISVNYFDHYIYRKKDFLTEPVSSFFENEFHYDKYHRALKNHDLVFLEKQGFPQYPESSYNKQTFKIKFNCLNVEGTILDVLSKSSHNQKRMVNKISNFLYLIFGNDLNGKSSYDLRDDLIKIPAQQTDKKSKKEVTYYKGFRLFSLPLNDIELVFKESKEYDDSENEFIVTEIHVNMNPVQEISVEEIGWCYHPMVYEWDK